MARHGGWKGGVPTRRQFLNGLGAIGGAAAVYHGAGMLGLLKMTSAQASVPDYPADAGRGRSAVVIGAGVAGIVAAYHLSRFGFAVTLLEANPRAGGRSFTARDGDSFAETGGPTQTVRLVQNSYPDGTPVDVPTYANCGAGRIGAHSALVLDYCHRFNTRLEPYQFYSASALLQSDSAFDGKPVPFRRIRHNLRGEIAEMLASTVQQGGIDQPLSANDQERFLQMLQQFGDLQVNADGRYFFEHTARAGFLVDPIADMEPGILAPKIGLDEIVRSDLWNRKLFQHMQYLWQATMVQPVGGMDMLWRNILRQQVPSGGLVSDRLRLNAPVARVANTDSGVSVVTEAGEEIRADFCVSTMAPPQLAARAVNLPPALVQALAAVPYRPSTTMAAQFDNRFWERDSPTTERILGGISWTDRITGQLWYPSGEFYTSHGVMRIVYNGGADAIRFGDMPLEQRLEEAIASGERFHPGQFAKHILRDSAISVAWHKMPYFMGVGAEYPYLGPGYEDAVRANLERYRFLKQNFPAGQVYLAGDYFSFTPGWKDGAIASAEQAAIGITERVLGG